MCAAVDIWSVGVIFLSLLAGHYPIFKATDDMEAISQIISVFGSEELKRAAKSYGKTCYRYILLSVITLPASGSEVL